MILPQPGRNLLLGGVALMLIALAIWPWVAPIAAPGRPASGESEAAPAVPLMPPLASFTGVFERPLFSPTRRPGLQAKAPAPSSGVERYRLLGLLSAGDERRALLSDGNKRIEIVEGAVLDGWTVARIEQDRVVLSSAGGITLLKLRRAGNTADRPATAEPPGNGSGR